MKNNRLKLGLAALGLLLFIMGATHNLSAQTSPLCRWDRSLEWCLVVANDGICAYGGSDCSTIPEVN